MAQKSSGESHLSTSVMEELLAEVNVVSGAGPAELDRLADDQRTLLVQVRKFIATLDKQGEYHSISIALLLDLSVSLNSFSSRVPYTAEDIACSTEGSFITVAPPVIVDKGSCSGMSSMGVHGTRRKRSAFSLRGRGNTETNVFVLTASTLYGVRDAVCSHRRCPAMARRCFFCGVGAVLMVVMMPPMDDDGGLWDDSC